MERPFWRSGWCLVSWSSAGKEARGGEGISETDSRRGTMARILTLNAGWEDLDHLDPARSVILRHLFPEGEDELVQCGLFVRGISV